MRRPEWGDVVVIYFGLLAVVGALTETTWWRWVFAALALWFLGWATIRLQKRWGIK